MSVIFGFKIKLDVRVRLVKHKKHLTDVVGGERLCVNALVRWYAGTICHGYTAAGFLLFLSQYFLLFLILSLPHQ